MISPHPFTIHSACTFSKPVILITKITCSIHVHVCIYNSTYSERLIKRHLSNEDTSLHLPKLMKTPLSNFPVPSVILVFLYVYDYIHVHVYMKKSSVQCQKKERCTPWTAVSGFWPSSAGCSTTLPGTTGLK